MTYQPKPIETKSVTLPRGLLGLTEQLAENNHDHWAVLKLADDWTFGPYHDPVAKHHPDLIPYAELSEEKKEYDRRTAMETLKAIVALGYRIEKSH
jgi:ryanodine receptor 2